jgi:carboxypeptidase D
MSFSKDAFVARGLSSCADFPSVDQIGATFLEMEQQQPEIARRLQIGTSVEGRPLYAIRLSVNPDEESMEPEIRIIGGIHGNECMGAEVSMLAAEWLVSGFADDPFVTRLLENAETVIIPLINPDGYSAEFATRANANNVDLNRNLHFAWVGDGPGPFSEPETRALRDFSQDNAFNLGISYHTISYYVNSSWNYTSHHPPDEALFQAVGEGYAGTSAFQVVFGWDWYNIQGDVNDWSLGTAGTFDWTLELMSDTDSQWLINEDGLAGFLSFVFQGIQGLVTDAKTGEPLFARIAVSPAGAPVFNDADVGDYNRLLLPGTYDVTAIAAGYEQKTITGIVVKEDEMSRVDFALKRDSTASATAFKVNGMSLPRAIPTSQYGPGNPYLNSTMVWEALGAPDGRPYSLSADPDIGDNPPIDLSGAVGALTLDMGDDTWVTDQPGADLRVVSATESDDPAAVLVASSQDGPFVLAAQSSGTFDVDIHDTGFAAIRFVRVVDLGDGPFNDPFSGYDLDAVVNLSVGDAPLADAGADSDDGGPADDDSDGDAGEIIGATTGGCGCSAAGTVASPNGMQLIRLLFQTR